MPSCHPSAILFPRSFPLLRPTRIFNVPVFLRGLQTTTTEIGVSWNTELRKPTSTSRRRIKKTRPSPSPRLIEALKIVGKLAVLPYSDSRKSGCNRLDLSYLRPNGVRRKLPRIVRVGVDKQPDRRIPLQGILASFIIQEWTRNRHGPSDGALKGKDLSERRSNLPVEQSQTLLSDEQCQLLRSKGYDYNDVKAWARIIYEENTSLAASELLLHSGAPASLEDPVRKPLPAFVPLFFARRSSMNNDGLRCLLVYAWQEVHRKQSYMVSKDGNATQPRRVSPDIDQYPLLDDSSMLILIIRLLRHARATWPEALVTVTRMFIEYFGDMKHSSLVHTSRRARIKSSNITILFNRMLELLALPSKNSSYRVVTYHQRAQFDLLQIMARHSPPLVITRGAYRAIISVQLRNSKTDQERDWGKLKAKSWPPWKQEKTGLDAEKGSAYGTSRALVVLNRSREAGYGGASWNRNAVIWDKVATILSGWDLDGSPTIQTRSLLLHKFVSQKDVTAAAWSKTIRADWSAFSDHKSVWAARIRTTRTVHEAWACFLAYSDRGLPPEGAIYIAMLEKLAYEHRRTHSTPDEENESAPGISEHALTAGDNKELLAPPSSPKESTFVRIQPPSFHDLANEMFGNNISPSGPWIGYLLKHAETLGQGMLYLDWLKQKTPSVECLLDPQPERNNKLLEVPLAIFGSFIGLLCRFPNGDQPISEHRQNGQFHESATLRCYSLHGVNPFTLACRLLEARHPLYRPAWHKVFVRLSSPVKNQDGSSEGNFSVFQCTRALHRWSLLQHLLKDMTNTGLSLDSETFRLLCRGIECVTLAAMVVISKSPHYNSNNPKIRLHHREADPWSEDSGIDVELTAQASNILKTGSQYVRSSFHDVMGTGKHLSPSHKAFNNSSLLPRLFTTPEGSFLHRYIRALGLLRDWQGILDTVRWMAKYEKEIAEGTSMARNGMKLLRNSIIAARIFLEGSWIDYDSSSIQMAQGIIGSLKVEYAAPPRIKEAVQRLVCSVEAWGGWPSDTEVDDYCTAADARFPSVKILLQIDRDHVI